MPALETIGDLLAHLRRLIAEPGPSRFSDQTLLNFLELASDSVVVDGEFADNVVPIPITAGQYLVDTPLDNVVRIISCHYAIGDPPNTEVRQELNYVSPEFMYRRVERDPFRPGVPDSFTIRQPGIYGPTGQDPTPGPDQVRVYPVPDRDGTLWFHWIQLPNWPDLNPQNVIAMRAAYRELVCMKAMVYVYENLGRADLRAAKEIEYRQHLAQAMFENWTQTVSFYEDYFRLKGAGHV